MGKSSSKVLTPRNVDLPTHVIRPPKEKINPRRKCLCLSLWLLVLLLVCGLVVLVASFLLPPGQNLLGTSPGFPFDTGDDPQGRMDCLESVGISLEQKTELSDLIVVGNFKEQVYRERYERDDSREVLEVRVTKNLKGRHPKREPIHYVSPPDFDSCHHAGGADSSWDEKRVFFLTKFGDFWVPRFQPLPISPNYYADLAARFDLPPELVDKMQRSNMLYDEEGGQAFFQCYSCDFSGNLFIELLQRGSGYRGFGAGNAPFRIAAQKRMNRKADQSKG